MSMKDLIISMMLEHLEEKATNPYAIGMAAAMKATGDEPPLEKSTIRKAHKIAKGIEKTEEVDLDEANVENKSKKSTYFGKLGADANNKTKGSKKLYPGSTAAIKLGRELTKEEVDLDEAVNAKKIIADHDAGHSVDAIVQKHLNKKADNKDEILKVIRNNTWNKRFKK